MIKKTVFTLNIDKYEPDICALTYPFLRRYADKIDADFYVITDRCFPDWPVVYEKLQIFKLGREMRNDWNIYIDSDALVHPDFFDVTEHLHKDTVMHNGIDMVGSRWKYNDYFRRDGRHISSCNWFTVGSDWCLDLWHPIDDMTPEQAIKNISPTVTELNTVITASHLIDDYTLSRNISRYGLKLETCVAMQARIGDAGNYLWHQYTMPVADKIKQMKDVMQKWGLHAQ